jgi:hypothetical protein
MAGLVREGWVTKPEEWGWSSFQNFRLKESQRAACPIRIDDVSLPDAYRGSPRKSPRQTPRRGLYLPAA